MLHTSMTRKCTVFLVAKKDGRPFCGVKTPIHFMFEYTFHGFLCFVSSLVLLWTFYQILVCLNYFCQSAFWGGQGIGANRLVLDHSLALRRRKPSNKKTPQKYLKLYIFFRNRANVIAICLFYKSKRGIVPYYVRTLYTCSNFTRTRFEMHSNTTFIRMYVHFIKHIGLSQPRNPTVHHILLDLYMLKVD